MLKQKIFLLTVACTVATVLAIYFISGIDSAQIKQLLQPFGIWTPIVYIVIYVLATVLMLPSTALNLAGGALFGLWWGTLWTSIAAVMAAIATFLFTRTIGRDFVEKKLAGRWGKMNAEIQSGGLFYIFAIRLLPIIPYGLVNLAAGLTSIRFRDYFWGTTLGTIPGLFPFVMLGSSGLTALQTGNILPLLLALGIIGLFVAGATWYKRRRSS